MNLVKEYKNQNSWRDWDFYLQKLPISNNDTIYDMGCSIGFVSKKLAKKTCKVIGIDNNAELINEAKKVNGANNIEYLTGELNNLDYQKLPHCNGIWASFVASYFPDFIPVMNNWKSILKPGGWLGIVEMSELFAHEPLSHSTREIFEKYYLRQCSNNSYDFTMGSKMKKYVLDSGFRIVHEENAYDKELAFNGPADSQIIKAWEDRFDRMFGFRKYVGVKKFESIKNEFLKCLVDKNHKSNTIVKFIIAMK